MEMSFEKDLYLVGQSLSVTPDADDNDQFKVLCGSIGLNRLLIQQMQEGRKMSKLGQPRHFKLKRADVYSLVDKLISVLKSPV